MTLSRNKISPKTIAIIVIATICTIAVIGGRIYKEYVLDSENTKIVEAEIIDVGTHYRGGTRLRHEGYIKFRYYIDDEEIESCYSSISLRDKVNQYQIGDCIELKVNLQNVQIYEWNEDGSVFKCNPE